MSESVLDGSGKAIFNVLAQESRLAFAGIVADIEKHVVPTMAMIAHSLVVIGAQLKSGEIDSETANIEVAMQANAAAAVIVGFANEILLNVQKIINVVLATAREVVNETLKVALL